MRQILIFGVLMAGVFGAQISNAAEKLGESRSGSYCKVVRAESTKDFRTEVIKTDAKARIESALAE